MHNTIGDRCQFCDTDNGYYGDATRGTPYDCVLGGKKSTTTTTTTTTTRPITSPIRLDIEIEPNPDCNCNGHAVACTCSGFCLVNKILKLK
jgi:hypothetical protein